MSRRIEIELTSARPDDTWTWRVAGAKQPKGVLEASLVPGDAKVGDVLRADAEFELEGVSIIAVLKPAPKRQERERLVLLGDTRPFEGVTTSLVTKGARSRRDRDDRGPRPSWAGERRDGPSARAGGPRGPGARDGGPGGHDRDARPAGPSSGSTGGPGHRGSVAEAEGHAAGGQRSGRRSEGAGARTDRPLGAPTDAGGTRADAGGSRPRSPGEHSDRTEGGRWPAHDRSRAEGRSDRGTDTVASSEARRSRRLNPSSTHRNAVVDSLAPEERPVAEQLLQGGIPAVRRAVKDRNTLAREEGRPEVKADALLVLAEELLPRLKAAEWRDRAEAATKDIGEVALRDLRSIVAGADAGARDDESRILAKTLREAVDARENAAREAWLAELTTNLDEGRVTRALRVAGRPPDPRTRFPPELMARLSDATSAAMAPDTPPDRWATLLAALLESPVRRSVKPVGLPSPPSETLLTAARQASGRVPALATMLGLDMPPPPGPPRPGVRPPKPATRSFGARRPAVVAQGPPAAPEVTPPPTEPPPTGPPPTGTPSETTPAESSSLAEAAPAEAAPAETPPPGPVSSEPETLEPERSEPQSPVDAHTTAPLAAQSDEVPAG